MQNKNQFASLLLLTALLFGGIIRFAAPMTAQGPVNDGGLFLQMTRDLQANHFILPQYTTYNDADIPFAYPPLGFYLAGVIQSISGVSLFDLFTYLPVVFCTIAILAFYCLALEITQDRLKASLAALFYATLPKSFDWFIMGGGTVRAIGLVFSFLTLMYAYRLFTKKNVRAVLPTAIFASLLILTHPETSFQVAFSTFVFALYFLRGRKSILHSVYVILLVVVFTSPWWLVLLTRHGMAPLQAALSVGTGLPDLATTILYFFQFNLGGEAILSIVAVLGLIGLVGDIRHRDFFLLVWIGSTFLVEPRAAPFASLSPLILLAIKGLDITLTGLGYPQDLANGFESKGARSVLLGLVTYIFMSGMIYSMQLGNQFRILPQERDAMEWIVQNTSQTSRFLVLTGESSLTDPLSEWFPALTGRISLLTVQGHEWTLKSPLLENLRAYNQAQACLNHDESCLSNWEFDYVYIRKIRPMPEGNVVERPNILDVSMRESQDYKVIFENEAAMIFQPVR